MLIVIFLFGGNHFLLKKDWLEIDFGGSKANQTSPDQIFFTATVERVIDGDTFVLTSGEKVRYIGIDAPEITGPQRKTAECFGVEASEANKKLLEGKEVKLEKDSSETDKYQRLLRYVYLGDIFVNDYLVRNGYAEAVSFPPDVKYQKILAEAEQEAKRENRGIWEEGICEKINNY